MAGENHEERACGQILFGLKMSNLNYMVKETPFSAYITIRKKFLKSYQPEFATPVTSDQKDDNTKLETDLKQAQKMNAELELKLEKSHDKSESLKKELANALETIEEITKGQITLKTD